MHKAFNVKLKG